MIKDYNLISDYYPEKANMVADALSRKSIVPFTYVKEIYLSLLTDLIALGPNMSTVEDGALIAKFIVKLVLVEEIKASQELDHKVLKEIERRWCHVV